MMGDTTTHLKNSYTFKQLLHTLKLEQPHMESQTKIHIHTGVSIMIDLNARDMSISICMQLLINFTSN